ncbi:MAG: dTMP kinase [Candidatus Bruticola sp.]
MGGKMNIKSRKGLFITLEGPEGGGKTSQAHALAESLRRRGLMVSVTREPGGTPLGDKIRQLLIDPANNEMFPLTELLLFEASRAQHVQEFILPKLSSGEVVICDRFYDSTLAYQGARNLPIDAVHYLNELAAAQCRPDFTLLLDLDYETGRSRLSKRYQRNSGSPDRIEQEDQAFFARLRQNYLDMAQGFLQGKELPGNFKDRWLVIDASVSFSEVSAKIWQAILPLIEAHINVLSAAQRT